MDIQKPGPRRVKRAGARPAWPGRWQGAAAAGRRCMHLLAGPSAGLTTARRGRKRRPSPRGAADWRRALLAEPAAAGATRRARVLRVAPWRLPTACAERATAEAMVAHSLRANVVAGAPGAGATSRGDRPAYSVRERGRMHAAAAPKEDGAPAAAGAAACCWALLAPLPAFLRNLAATTNNLHGCKRLAPPLLTTPPLLTLRRLARRVGGGLVAFSSVN